MGIRREESKERAKFPELIEGSLAHGGRDLRAPLVNHTAEMRNELLKRAGWNVLPHRSQECYPCINSNRSDLRTIDENRIQLIEKFEGPNGEMGKGKKSGKAKRMFRPYRHQGAKGIRNVIRWANDGRYIEGQEDLWSSGCGDGWCE